jgi:hypothetical protein
MWIRAATNLMPEQFNLDGRLEPKAWSFHNDSKYYNSFTKPIRYEGALQREFSRALRELRLLQEDRRASQAKPPDPPETPETKKNRTQFPDAADPSARENKAALPDPPQNPAPGGPKTRIAAQNRSKFAFD